MQHVAITFTHSRGIDYMLQAKLADARAQEAEQKLEGTSLTNTLPNYIHGSM